MKKLFVLLLFLVFIINSGFSQKSETRSKGIALGLSYKVYEFYFEDYAIAPDKLDNGKWADGLLGLNIGYVAGFNKIIGFNIDYRFLFGAFQRGFEYYQYAANTSDPATGHQLFIGPSLNIGKTNFNMSIKAQLGYDYLKVKGKADYFKIVATSSSITYVGQSSSWINWLNNYNQTGSNTITREGYPEYKRKGFLYQIGANINFTREKASFIISFNYCPVKYNNIIHKEFDIGMGTILHF